VIFSRRGDYTDRVYGVLGEGMHKDELAIRLHHLEQRSPERYDVVLSVCERIKAVDILGQRDVAKKLDEVRPHFVVSLQIYLLSTCADALMKHKYQGTWKRFSGFFVDLPDPAKRALTEDFWMVRYIRGTKQVRPNHHWEQMNLDERVKEISEYHYKCHRLPFTHEADLCGGLSQSWRENLGFEEDPLPGFPETWRYQTSDDHFIFYYKVDPVRVLRTTIVTGAQTYHLMRCEPTSSAAG